MYIIRRVDTDEYYDGAQGWTDNIENAAILTKVRKDEIVSTSDEKLYCVYSVDFRPEDSETMILTLKEN